MDDSTRDVGLRPDASEIEADGGPWPELPVPADVVISCQSFGMSGHGRLVWAEGSAEAPFMCILDNPGAREDKLGNPYTCGTRLTLRAAAREAGLDVDELYITYLVKCRPLRAYDKSLARDVGRGFLQQQACLLLPQVLVLFGDVVTRCLTGDVQASVRALRGTTLRIFDTPAIVTYHPLAARRRTNLYPLLVADLRRVLATP